MKTRDAAYIFPRNESGGPLEWIECRSFSFYDERHGVLAVKNFSSDKTMLMQTSDGGVTWEKILESPVESEFKSVFMFDETHGWAGGENGLFYILTNRIVGVGHGKQSAEHRINSPEKMKMDSYLLNGQKVSDRLPLPSQWRRIIVKRF